jgi:hypothetical protein
MAMEPTAERLQLQPDDLRWAAHVCAEALGPALDRDWRTPAGDLEWDAYTTLDHVVDALGYYAIHLATRATTEVPFATRSTVMAEPRAGAGSLMAGLQAMSAVLADVARAAPKGTRAYHDYGLADADGLIAIGCDEIMVHTDDLARGFGLAWQPPEALCRRVLARLFPWAPSVGDPWSTLLWANGRIALVGHPRLGPDWAWQAAPLSEWDGTIRKIPSLS